MNHCNSVTLMGKIISEINSKETSDGVFSCFKIETIEKYQNVKYNVVKETICSIDVNVPGEMEANGMIGFKQGDTILVEGRLNLEVSIGNNGKKLYTYYIVANKAVSPSSK